MTEVSGRNFVTEVLQAQQPVLVDFHATWCGPCKMIAPALEQLAEKYAGKVKIVKVDVDEAQEVAAKYNISGVPTLIMFKGGQAVGQVVGANLGQIKAELEKVVGKA